MWFTIAAIAPHPVFPFGEFCDPCIGRRNHQQTILVDSLVDGGEEMDGP